MQTHRGAFDEGCTSEGCDLRCKSQVRGGDSLWVDPGRACADRLEDFRSVAHCLDGAESRGMHERRLGRICMVQFDRHVTQASGDAVTGSEAARLKSSVRQHWACYRQYSGGQERESDCCMPYSNVYRCDFRPLGAVALSFQYAGVIAVGRAGMCVSAPRLGSVDSARSAEDMHVHRPCQGHELER